jgi:SulP family sulfate permease
MKSASRSGFLKQLDEDDDGDSTGRNPTLMKRLSYSPIELAHVPLPASLLDTSDPLPASLLGYDQTEEGVQAHFPSGLSVQRGSSFKARSIIETGGALVHKACRRSAHGLRSCCTRESLRRKVPMVTWMRDYSRSLLRADLLAGITVGVVLIPQGVAYAMLAELPPIYGLYASIVPLPIYAAMATSRHMSIGPFALVSLLVADSVSEVVPPEDDSYIGAVMLLSLMIGLLHCLMHALNLGVIVRFISDAVLAGFTTAAAILISASQLKHLLGMPIPRDTLFPTLYYIASHAGSINPVALAVGLCGILLLDVFKKANKRFCKAIPLPEQLLLLVLATLLSWGLGLEKQNYFDDLGSLGGAAAAANGNATLLAGANASSMAAVVDHPRGNATAAAHPSRQWLSLPTVGVVPSGLPQFTIPDLTLLIEMMPPALVVGVFSFILSSSIVKTFSIKYDYATDSNQELLAMGVANIVGSFFLAYPAAGSLSRSALVSTSCGAVCTPLHGLFTSALVLLVLLFLTPTFRPMPNACLASIVFMAVKSLFDLSKARHLYRVSSSDFVAWCTAFTATLLFGVQLGIAFGILVSLLIIVMRSAWPHYAVLGRLPRTNIFRDTKRYPDAEAIDGVLLFRFDASLHFANGDFFRSSLLNAIDEKWAAADQPQGGPPGGPQQLLTAVVVDFSSVNDVDASALRVLQDVLKTLKERKLRLLFCSCKGQVRDVFERSGFLKDISPSSLCVSLPEGVKYGARLHAVRTGQAAPKSPPHTPSSPLPSRTAQQPAKGAGLEPSAQHPSCAVIGSPPSLS